MDVQAFETFTNSWWPFIIASVISLIGGIKFYMAGPTYNENINICGKIILITGASSGIGLATVVELARKGASVILTCRNEDKGRKALEYLKSIEITENIDLRNLDVSSMSNIREFVKKLEKDYNKIDVLINNAGIINHQYEKTPEGLELTFATNYLGPFLLSHLLLPLLKKSDNGRIINLTSLAHFSAKLSATNLNFCKEFIYREVYGQTKLALVLFTAHLGKLLHDTKIKVFAVSPGLVRSTNHMKNSPLNSSWMTKVSVYPWMWLFLKSPRQGCQSIVYASVDSALDDATGCYISDCEIKEPSELTKDTKLMEKIYEQSCSLCGITSIKTLH